MKLPVNITRPKGKNHYQLTISVNGKRENKSFSGIKYGSQEKALEAAKLRKEQKNQGVKSRGQPA